MASSDDDDEEEDFKLAIALSLQDQRKNSDDSSQSHKSGLKQETIDLEDGNDPIVTRLALHPNFNTVSEIGAILPNSMGLDRKAMEQERLARKRRASVSPPRTRKSFKISDGIVSEYRDIASNLSQHTRSLDLPAAKSFEKEPKPVAFSTFTDEPIFLNGLVRKTWALGHSRYEDIKIEEVLQREELTSAVLSSFQWDIEWLLRKLNITTTHITLVMQAKEESTKRQYEQETSTMANLRLCFPPMEGQTSCMHSKLMLLSHRSYLRVVVPTANLVPYDWGETGVMENMVFLIDLPRLPNEHTQINKEDLTPFATELVYFLESMKLEKKIIRSIYNFDFSKTKDLAFVHSIGGTHGGQEELWRRTGFCGLGKAVQELGLATDRALLVDFVTSSIGSLNVDFLSTLYLAAQGDDGLTEYEWRNPRPNRAKGILGKHRQAKAVRTEIQEQIEDGFRIYFPTHETVAASAGGTPSGGTICFQSKWYSSPTFPRNLLRDCKSRRAGLLMHNKVRSIRDTRFLS